ncbi:MAG: 23S rRNA (uracil(1939)-C(5))-methyltransferase RlmD [Desulfobulbaceae bacterium]|uniref:23S rRNA (Uracil(1939)-C(5))-methyltransferase RlmD n=1 Tax=Candidatus Desulfatifera sulfidica TaxID=2841691 RepID=A0A8J6N619_9BACT|nr:23S rRNA (uracil(1939)-C(5))-methyltransferase RlmD [Candidatus Desulfatifera sulfidica]
MKKNPEQLRVEKIVNGGMGLGRLSDGRVCLTPGVLPGELISVQICDKHKGVLQAAVKKILEPSADRTPHPCPLAKTCGGCDLQHCSYPGQLQIKKHILNDLFTRSGNADVQQAAIQIKEPLSAPQPFHYRQRIRLQVDTYGRPGFRKKASHDCIPIRECLLAAPQINDALATLMADSGFQTLLSNSRELELHLNPGSGRVTVILHQRRPPRPRDFSLARELMGSQVTSLPEGLFFLGDNFPLTRADQGTTPIIFSQHIPPLAGFTDTPLQLSWEAGGFCQVNLEQNINLIRTVLEFSHVNTDETVLDLFCGMGNFSIPLACNAHEVFGIEGQGAAIRSATKNAKTAALHNTSFSKGSIHQSCHELIKKGQTFDCVLVDPPRAGIPGLADVLAQLTRQRLIYVSCDPATLCRDLADLSLQGFTIHTVQPVDMFPQTHHLETVVLLERH